MNICWMMDNPSSRLFFHGCKSKSYRGLIISQPLLGPNLGPVKGEQTQSWGCAGRTLGCLTRLPHPTLELIPVQDWGITCHKCQRSFVKSTMAQRLLYWAFLSYEAFGHVFKMQRWIQRHKDKWDAALWGHRGWGQEFCLGGGGGVGCASRLYKWTNCEGGPWMKRRVSVLGRQAFAFGKADVYRIFTILSLTLTKTYSNLE